MRVNNVYTLTVYAHDLDKPFNSFKNEKLTKDDFKKHIREQWDYNNKIDYVNPRIERFNLKDYKPKRGKFDDLFESETF